MEKRNDVPVVLFGGSDTTSLISMGDTTSVPATLKSSRTPSSEEGSDTLLVPLPPTPYYKIQDRFLFDDLENGPAEPRDRYNLYFIAFMVLGAGFHLPFNSFVAAVDYFMLSFSRSNMAFIVASANSYTVCVAVIANVALVNRISTHRRISFGYLAFLLSLCSMALLVALTILGAVGSDTGFLVTIAATVLTGVGCGVQEASYYGYAGMLPSRYTRALMLGESFAGLVVSVNRIITKLTIEDPLTNTVIFFSLSIVGEIVCIILHRYIKNSKFVRHYQEKEVMPPSPLSLRASKGSLWKSIREGLSLRIQVSRGIWKLMVGILNVYLVTNLLYPGLASVVQSSWRDGWLPVILITAFNLSDLAGTMATGLHWKMSEHVLLLVGAARWALVPLLLLCVLPHGTPRLPGEAAPLLIVTILGASTGYMGSTPMCAASDKVAPQHREMAGNLMTMMMLLGLTLGSTSALLVNGLLGVGGHAEF